MKTTLFTILCSLSLALLTPAFALETSSTQGLGSAETESCPSKKDLRQKAYSKRYEGLQADIQLTDTTIDAIVKLSSGNPGALSILVNIATNDIVEKVDPANFLGILGLLLSLDMHGIYAENIWILYKDVCKEDVVIFIAVLRAMQLSLIDCNSVYYALENRGDCLDTDQVLQAVQKRLPSFARDLGNVDAHGHDEL